MLWDATILCKAIIYELQLLAVKRQGYFRQSLRTQHSDCSCLSPKAITVVTFRRKLAQTLKLDPVLTLSVLEVFRPGHLVWTTKQRWDPMSGVRGGVPSQAGAFREHSTHLCTLGSQQSFAPNYWQMSWTSILSKPCWGKEKWSVLTCRSDGCIRYLFTLSSMSQTSALIQTVPPATSQSAHSSSVFHRDASMKNHLP